MGKNNKYRSVDDHPYWETVKRLPTFQAKVEYTWENWRVHILGVAFIIVLISSVAISNLMNNTPSYLTGAYVNLMLVDQHENYRADYLDQVFLHDHLGLPEDQDITMRCFMDMPLDLSGSSELAELSGNTMTRLDGMLPSNEIDYLVFTENLVDWFGKRYGNALLDLREFLTAEELELYADRLRYTKSGVPVGIDISDSPLLSDMCLSADKPVCFGWFAFVEQKDHMRPFFDYLMSTLP